MYRKSISQVVYINESSPLGEGGVVGFLKGAAEVVGRDLNAAAFNSPAMQAIANGCISHQLINGGDLVSHSAISGGVGTGGSLLPMTTQ